MITSSSLITAAPYGNDHCAILKLCNYFYGYVIMANKPMWFLITYTCYLENCCQVDMNLMFKMLYTFTNIKLS